MSTIITTEEREAISVRCELAKGDFKIYGDPTAVAAVISIVNYDADALLAALKAAKARVEQIEAELVVMANSHESQVIQNKWKNRHINMLRDAIQKAIGRQGGRERTTEQFVADVEYLAKRLKDEHLRAGQTEAERDVLAHQIAKNLGCPGLIDGCPYSYCIYGKFGKGTPDCWLAYSKQAAKHRVAG